VTAKAVDVVGAGVTRLRRSTPPSLADRKTDTQPGKAGRFGQVSASTSRLGGGAEVGAGQHACRRVKPS